MQVCANCGTENPDGFRLCGMCGTALAVTIGGERRERRVVSVLFADLVGFTSRSEQLDVEDVGGFLGPYQALLQAEVERTGGVVAKSTGDGVPTCSGALLPMRTTRSGRFGAASGSAAGWHPAPGG